MRFFVVILLVALTGSTCRGADTASGVLAEINFARTRPWEYAKALISCGSLFQTRESQKTLVEAISFLQKVRPVPPLDFSAGMAQSAQSHIADQGPRGTVGHRGSDRSRSWDRMAQYGTWSGVVGENISYGFKEPRSIVAQLIVDYGVRNRGHRKNIFNGAYGVAGVAVGRHAKFGSMCVIDFAGGFTEKSGEMAGRVANPGQVFRPL